MARGYVCDTCARAIPAGEPVRALRAYTIPDEEQAPWRDAKIGTRRIVHQCAACWPDTVARLTGAETETGPAEMVERVEREGVA